MNPMPHHRFRLALWSSIILTTLISGPPAFPSAAPPDRSGPAGHITVEERTKELGLWEPLLGMFVHTCAAADVNGDGWLDLFVGGFYQQLPRDKFFRLGERGAKRDPAGPAVAGRPRRFHR